MKRLSLSLVMSLAFVAFLAPSAFSDTITFTFQQYDAGTGFGAITNLLSLQATPNESGSVVPTSVPTGDATNTSKTWTVAQLTALGFTPSNLAIIFNISDPGSGKTESVDLASFSLDFWHSGDATRYAFTPLTGTLPITNLVPVGGSGTGTAGWLMTYQNAGVLDAFFSNPNNVLGATGSVLNSSDGQENFYLVKLATPVPEPGTMMLLGSGLVGLAGWGRKKFRK